MANPSEAVVRLLGAGSLNDGVMTLLCFGKCDEAGLLAVRKGLVSPGEVNLSPEERELFKRGGKFREIVRRVSR